MSAAASIRAAAITVELGDWEYEIPALPAADWLEAMLLGWTGVVPGMLGVEDQLSIMKDYSRGHFTKDDLTASCRAAVEAATGRRWWWVEKIVGTGCSDDIWPTLHGALLLRGADLERWSFGGLLSAMYVVMVEHMKDDKRAMFDAQLDAPPPGAVAAEWDDAAAEEDFMAALGQQAKLNAG